jgi:uncharacterized protein (DUF1330 family)
MTDLSAPGPGPDAVAALRGRDLSQPIGALNLLKFRPRANYEPGSGETPCSGEEAYSRYATLVTPILAAMGAHAILSGVAWMLGRPGEWDRAFVVRYPTATLLLELPQHAEYAKIAHHRTAALADSRLLVMEFNPGGLS